jgi:hypothetical protein
MFSFLACRTSGVWKITTAPIFFRKLQFLTPLFFIAILICLNMTDFSMSQRYFITSLELYLLYTFAAVYLHIFTAKGSTGETAMGCRAKNEIRTWASLQQAIAIQPELCCTIPELRCSLLNYAGPYLSCAAPYMSYVA